MPSDVKLNIKTSHSNGFLHAKSTKNGNYYYKFTGGNGGGNGNNEFNAAATFKVEFNGSATNGYSFLATSFQSKSNPTDLSQQSNTASEVVIADSWTTKPATFNYGVKVQIADDTNDTITCDPAVTNLPA